MDDLLEGLSRIDLSTATRSDGDKRAAVHPREMLRGLLARAFSHDLAYLGACRAWREAALSDRELEQLETQIHAWSTERTIRLFEALQKFRGARRNIEIRGLASTMDSLFWSLLGRASQMSRAELNRQVDAATQLIYHAIFTDAAR